jgi:lactate dehydrogenase-like 2-hydroxyacid dehydrogenase
MLKLGLIGYGTIGRAVADAVARGEAGDTRPLTRSGQVAPPIFATLSPF